MKSAELHPTAWGGLRALQEGPAHAVLLHGAAGLQKTELAQEFAAALLCERPGSEGACGDCHPCNWMSQGNHPDFRLIRPDSESVEEGSGDATSTGKGKPSREIRVEQIRALNGFLNVGAHRAGRRIVLVNPAEAMNRNTANALLKVLEEPNPGVFFLLVSNDLDALLPTLRSRCLKQLVPTPDPTRALSWLGERGITKDASVYLARAGGAPGLALSIASGAEGRLLKVLEGLLADWPTFDGKRAAAEIERVLRSESDLEMMSAVVWTQRWLIDGLLWSRDLPARYFPGRTFNVSPICGDLFLKNIEKCSEFKVLSKHPLNPRLFLESFFDQCIPRMEGGRR